MRWYVIVWVTGLILLSIVLATLGFAVHYGIQ